MNTPLVSVVVPTFQRPDRLARCLRALAAQDYPRDATEVIVVDDAAGAMPLGAVVEPFRGELTVTLVTERHGGPAHARNLGAARARGSLLTFTDDDCVPGTGWLRSFVEATRTAPEALLGGRTLNALQSSACSSASQLLIDYLYAYYNSDSGGARFFASNNVALPAALFRAAGGFDAGFTRAAGEDREFADRWLRLGHPMVYVPEATVEHAHPLGLGSFWMQHLNYGRGAHRFRMIRARRSGVPIRLEPLSFYVNLVRWPVARERGARAAGFASLLVLSQVANALGFLWAKLSRED